jgi:hypothetical protein
MDTDGHRSRARQVLPTHHVATPPVEGLSPPAATGALALYPHCGGTNRAATSARPAVDGDGGGLPPAPL